METVFNGVLKISVILLKGYKNTIISLSYSQGWLF